MRIGSSSYYLRDDMGLPNASIVIYFMLETRLTDQ